MRDIWKRPNIETLLNPALSSCFGAIIYWLERSISQREAVWYAHCVFEYIFCSSTCFRINIGT